MRLQCSTLLLLPQLVSVALAASAWSFSDASLSITTKGAGVGGGSKEKFSPTEPLASAVTLTAGGTLKVYLTTLEGKSAKRPHQAFLKLEEADSGLQESFPFTISDGGKAKLQLTSKDLPFQLATSLKPLKAGIILGSFGSSTPLNTEAFQLAVETDSRSAPAAPSAAERYAAKPEIHHIFRADPRSPPIVLSAFFSLAVVLTLPLLLAAWLITGANISHFGKAFSSSPLGHAAFFGSIVAMEFVFYMYYVSWNLFQTLPVMAVVGLVAYVSGSKALTEVQERRLAGER